MRWGIVVAALALVVWVVLVSCKSSADCGQPDQTVYECAPQSVDLPGCHEEGSDASYPVGCTEVLPRCTPAYGDPMTCTCSEGPTAADDGGPSFNFICPL